MLNNSALFFIYSISSALIFQLLSKNVLQRFLLTRCLFISSVLFSVSVNAGKLESFERDAQSSAETNRYNSSSTEADDSTSIGGEVIGAALSVLLEASLDLFLLGSASSYELTASAFRDDKPNTEADDNSLPNNKQNSTKANNSKSDDEEFNQFIGRRHFGQSVLPIAKISLAQGYISDDIRLEDIELELGAAFFSLSHKRSIFHEQSADDSLSINQTFLNYRLTFTQYFQLNFALGNYQLKGNNTTNTGAIKWGLGVYPDKFGIEANFVSTHYPLSIEDSEYSIHYNFDYLALKAGYRIIETRNSDLSGPLIALTLVF